MRGRALNTITRAAAAILAVVALAASLAACGGSSSPSVPALLDATFHTHAPIPSGQLELTLSLAAPAQPLRLRLTGPFQNTGPGRLPSFALALSLTTAGRTLRAGLTSAGGRLYVELGGAWFIAPPSARDALTQGYAGSGVDPGRWLLGPRRAGVATVAGEPTTHLRAGLDTERFLADVRRLAGTGLLSSAQLTALSTAARTARVDLYTGRSDHRLRRLSLAGPGLRVELRFSDLGRPEAIAAPRDPHPLSQLISELRRAGVGV